MSARIGEFARENDDAILMGFGASTHSVAEKRLLLQGKAYEKGQGILSLLAKGLLPGGRI